MGQSQSKRMDKYVATYERAFERIETDLVRVVQRRDRQHRVRQGLALYTAVGVVGIAVAAAVLVQRVQRAPAGTYTAREHAARTSAGLAMPFVAAALRWLLLLLLGAADARAASRVAALEAAKRALVRELKDACRFDTARRLLARYDPDERQQQQQKGPSAAQQQQQMQQQMQRRRSAAAAAAGGGAQQQQPRHNNPNNPHSPQLLASAGAAAASAVAGAGRAVLPLIDRLAATLIADNPVLLEDVRQARCALAEAGAVAAAAARENEALRARVAELEAMLGFGGGSAPGSEAGGAGGVVGAGAPVAEEEEEEEEGAAGRRRVEAQEEEEDDDDEAAPAAEETTTGKGGDEQRATVELAATANGGSGGGGGRGGGARQRRRNGARS